MLGLIIGKSKVLFEILYAAFLVTSFNNLFFAGEEQKLTFGEQWKDYFDNPHNYWDNRTNKVGLHALANFHISFFCE